MSEVPGVDHITILYSAEAARRIVDWLATTLGPGTRHARDAGPDPRFPWSALGSLAALVLGFGAPRCARAARAARSGSPPIARPLAHLLLLAIALAGAVLVLSGVDVARVARARSRSFRFAIGRELFGFFALAGAFLLALGARRRAASADGLVDARTWLAAGLLFALALRW